MEELVVTENWRMREPVGKFQAGALLPRKEDTKAQREEMLNELMTLPRLESVEASDKQELCRRKLLACRLLFDFSEDNQKSEEEKLKISAAINAKYQTLVELVEYLDNGTRTACERFSEGLYADAMAMVSVNIFRGLPVRRAHLLPTGLLDLDEEEPYLEPTWPHLAVVYEFFLQFIVSNDVLPNIAKRYIDSNVMLKLVDLFDSDDPRERDYLKTLLHRLYGKFMSLRSFIRKAIQYMFFKVVYDFESHRGIAELLDILTSIVNGFALPLKSEHREFLRTALVPLHSVKSLHPFHQQLTQCLTHYMDKDPSVATVVVDAVLKYWPNYVASKQTLFLLELEEILEVIQADAFEQVKMRVFRKLAQCICCSHFQLAERALYFWQNETIANLINLHRADLYPLLVGPLLSNILPTAHCSWNHGISVLSCNVIKVMMSNDAALFERCKLELVAKEETRCSELAESDKIWTELVTAYDSNQLTD
eukprot:GEMP01009005.1.p1 GENE.GEMP01009005.1~~GEMP01009005.1.p1  ORF type:complete len:480 (+),score=80.27 GEMP01009005.1:180-1619(+)